MCYPARMTDTGCSCGCGQLIPAKHLFRYRPPYFLRGHAATGICACGCGRPLTLTANARYNRPRFIRNHDKRAPIPEARLCGCGCGRTTTIRKGHALQFISGHNSSGMKRGPGRYVNAAGYVLVRMPDHPNAMKGYVLEHRWVMEQTLGRLLLSHEPVHHQNHDKTDNRPENLELLDQHSHGKKHGRPRGHRLCSITGCGRSHYAHDYCATHYERVRKHGDPLTAHIPGRPPKRIGCIVENCHKPHRAKGYCSGHYQQVKRVYGAVS